MRIVTPEEKHDEYDLERRLDFIIRELDEFIALIVANPSKLGPIQSEKIAFGQISIRIQLILSRIL
jgi:hypothetical protein